MACKAIDQRCFESNGLFKNKDIKLKKRKTFQKKYKIYILLIIIFVMYFTRVPQASSDTKVNTPSLLG